MKTEKRGVVGRRTFPSKLDGTRERVQGAFDDRATTAVMATVHRKQNPSPRDATVLTAEGIPVELKKARARSKTWVTANSASGHYQPGSILAEDSLFQEARIASPKT